MLKKAILSVALALVTVSGYSQGQVLFTTSNLGTSAQVFNELGALATGTAYFAQLYAASGSGQSESSLVAVGFPVNFRAGPNAGYVQVSGTTSLGVPITTTTIDVTGVNGGAATLQLRAWSSAFATYAAAVAGGGAAGKSALLNLAGTGRGGDQPPGTPVDLIGLQGFTMAVPEPTTFALLGLGVAGLLFRRRK